MGAKSAGFLSRLISKFGGNQTQVEIRKALAQLDQPNPDARRSAAFRLGKFGENNEEVREALQRLRTDPVKEVRNAATWALKEVGSRD